MSSDASTSTSARSSAYLYFLIAIAAAGLVAAGFTCGLYFWQFHGSLSTHHDRWAEFGDIFGGLLNPILSFLSLIAVLITVGVQVQELRISTKEMHDSAQALQKQNETLRHQNFESSFFQLLSLHNDIVNALEVSANNGIKHGRDCLNHLAAELTETISSMGTDWEHCDRGYDKFYKKREPKIGHYFRLLYNIIKHVDRASGLDDSQKKFYTNLVRAQLSSSELLLIYFNCATHRGQEKLKPLVEKYALLKTLRKIPPCGMVLLQQYSGTAFDGNIPQRED